MRIDFATLAFGYNIQVGGGTPNWATSLGQSKERDYRINDNPQIDELLRGMTYKSVSLSKISTKIGKGGRICQGSSIDSPIILASMFEKVFINNTRVDNGKYIILVTRDTSDSHFGRLRFKYGPCNTYTDNNVSYSNETFWNRMKVQFGLKDEACFFVYDISIKNQDELRFKTVFVNKTETESYYDSRKHHEAWEALIEANDRNYGWTGSNEVSEAETENSFRASKEKGAINKIYYGAPGCGKSRYIKDMLKQNGVQNDRIVRVTFHPEYDNSDFVGQILPSVEENIDNVSGERKEIVKYTFTPGPFTIALLKAYKSQSMIYLIIEEINRGNASAIFGDLFQLLDREKDEENLRWSESEYPIWNSNVLEYLEDNLEQENPYDISLINGIYLPSNLSIYATMNSSDQNVFTLDTAFKRRWSFEQISNDIEKDSVHPYKLWYVPGTNVTWESFLIKINNEILDKKVINEDKRLGKYFVSRDCLTKNANEINQEASKNFAYKVIEYVWNDVCKMSKDEWFDTIKYKTLENLIDAFMFPELGSSPLSIFKGLIF